MKLFTDELLMRFPEIKDSVFEGDEELPYLMMLHLCNWVRQQIKEGFNAQITRRLVEFSRWCESQPKGNDASDDVYTIYVVGFLEKLIEDDDIRVFVPQLLSKSDLMEGREYWITWIGQEAYDKALAEFDTK